MAISTGRGLPLVGDLLEIENESDRVAALYNIFEESTRLSTKATQVEFLTTIRQIEKHLKPGMKILDLGAGVDTFATGHPAERKINDPNLWKNEEWVKAVFNKLKEFEERLQS